VPAGTSRSVSLTLGPKPTVPACYLPFRTFPSGGPGGVFPMGKFILVSILIATVAAPVIGASHRSPRRGLGQTLLFLFLFNVAWLAVLVLVYASSYKPELW